MSVREILNNVKGHQIRVPCLFSLSPSWQARLNPEYDHSVEESLEAWRQNWLSDPACYERNAGADCAFFTRTVNPEATKASMKTVAKLSSWVFAWDDVLDFGTLDLSPKDRKVFYDETVSVIKESILNDPMKPQPFEAIAPTFKVAQSFYEIGELIHAGSQHLAVREFVCETLCDYVTAAIKMEDAFQEDIIQGLDEYISNRMGSSCVYGIIAISLYAKDIDIPAWFLNHPLVKDMMRQVNIMVALDNDIVSVHHELNCNHIDNLVLLLVYHQGMTPQQAVDHCCQLIRQSYATFQSLEAQVLALATEHDIAEAGTAVIDCCKDVRIGLVNWLYHVKGYFDFKPKDGEREVWITLS